MATWCHVGVTKKKNLIRKLLLMAINMATVRSREKQERQREDGVSDCKILILKTRSLAIVLI